MVEFIEGIWLWIANLANEHNVNPTIFGILYLGSYPPYIVSIAWLVKSFKEKKSLHIPVLSTAFWFIVPSLYVIAVGRNVSWYVYVIIVLFTIYTGYLATKKIKSKLNQNN